MVFNFIYICSVTFETFNLPNDENVNAENVDKKLFDFKVLLGARNFKMADSSFSHVANGRYDQRLYT